MMKKRDRISRLTLALASLAIVAIFQVVTVAPATAYNFSLGGWEGTLFTQLSYSVGVRANSPRSVEERNAKLHSLQGLLYQTQRDYVFDDAGDVYTNIFKVSPELMLTKDNYGLFVRATGYYDTVIMHSNPDFSNYLINQGNDDWTDSTKDKQGLGVELYDAYVFADFEVDDLLGMGYAPISVRLGNQAYNWGEGSFYLDGINTTNALDVNKLNSPGLEMKEATLPVPSVLVQVGLFDALSLEGFTHFGWRKHRFPAAGTFFHTDDDLLGPGHNGLYYDVGTLLSFPSDPADPSFGDLAGVIAGNYAFPLMLVKKKTNDADDMGQFGLSARYTFEESGVELGAYFINYHHQEPYFRFLPGDGAGGAGTMEFVYPENQKLLGLSLATQVGLWAVAGEVVYQPDHPVWYGDPLVHAFDSAVANVFGDPDVRVNIDGTEYDPATQTFNAYVERDIYHGQINALRAFGPGLGFDTTFLVLAASVDHVAGDLSGLQGNGNGEVPVDDFAWGYNAEIDFTKFNAFGVPGLDVSPGFGWQHAVDGYSRMWGNWWEGKKWFQARLKASYRDIDYNLNYVGIRQEDKFAAADYENEHIDTVNFSISYKF